MSITIAVDVAKCAVPHASIDSYLTRPHRHPPVTIVFSGPRIDAMARRP